MRKSIFHKDSNEIYSDVINDRWEDGTPYFDTENQSEVTVQLLPDKSIPPGLFRPDPERPGTFHANPVTIKAVRKDIFTSDNLDEFSEPYTCESCKHELDLQYWIFCPYCEAKFKVD